MCGIVGAIAKSDVVKSTLLGLQALEYRGYDSAGIAVINECQQLQCVKAIGKIAVLQQKLQAKPLFGKVAIAHTRWATHGKPTVANAHPHVVGKIAVVHNGIINGSERLRAQLRKEGCQFKSETDTEVIAHLIARAWRSGADLLAVVTKVTKKLSGSFAIAVICSDIPNEIVVARHGCPLVLGVAKQIKGVASDAVALSGMTRQVIYLADGDVARLTADSVTICDCDGNEVKRPVQKLKNMQQAVSKGKYAHFMLKEIFEQPKIIAQILKRHLTADGVDFAYFGTRAAQLLPRVKRIHLVACGSSYHAALVGKYWLESLAGISCQVEVASEFCTRSPVVERGTLFIAISQSGETADTLNALRLAQQLPFLARLAICNVPNSSLMRESDLGCLIEAGVEIGVATTKAFTAQLLALLFLAFKLAAKDRLVAVQPIIKSLTKLPRILQRTLTLDTVIKRLAQQLLRAQHSFYLGRGINYPVALEGALKIKEISYIHAEGCAAGELKHGPLALIESGVPVVALLANDDLQTKMLANLQEVKLRGALALIFYDGKVQLPTELAQEACVLPAVSGELFPFVASVALQLLAYYVALLKKVDIDQPRNLAKSVTVE